MGSLLLTTAGAAASAAPFDGEREQKAPSVRVELIATDDAELTATIERILRQAGLSPITDAAGADGGTAQGDAFATLVISRADARWTEVRIDGNDENSVHVRRVLERQGSAVIENEEIGLVIRSALVALGRAPDPLPTSAVDAGGAGPLEPTDGGADSHATPTPEPAAPFLTRSVVAGDAAMAVARSTQELSAQAFATLSSFAADHAPRAGAEAAFEWAYAREGLRPALLLQSGYEAPTATQPAGFRVQTTDVPVRLYASIRALRAGRFSLDVAGGFGAEFVKTVASATESSAIPRPTPVYVVATAGASLRASLELTHRTRLVAAICADAAINPPKFVVGGATEETVLTPLRVRPCAMLGVSFTAFGGGAP